MADIVHRIGIKASADEVFKKLSTLEGLGAWWTENVSGSSKVGDTITFAFKTKSGDLLGEMQMKVDQLSQGERVQWTCLSGPAEWIGTQIVFNLSQQKEYTIVNFAHANWKEVVEFTGHCSTKWAVFLMSLRELVETGKGKASPNDIKIDNWN